MVVWEIKVSIGGGGRVMVVVVEEGEIKGVEVVVIVVWQF